MFHYNQRMEFDFSSAARPGPNLSITLHAVYCLHADSTYDVRKKLSGNGEWVILRTLAGEGCVQLEGLPEMTVSADTLLYFRHEDVRRYYCSGELWQFYWFEFLCEERIGFSANTLMHVDPPEKEQDDCHTCLVLLRGEDEEAGSRASAFFCLLLYKWRLAVGASEKKGPYHLMIQQVVLELNACTDHPVSVGSMAGKVGLCERRFRQVFEQEMGTSPKKYHESVRMRMAEALLRNTSLPLGEIAERLGYCNPFYFSRRFQAIHGVAPSHFRNK